MLRAISSLGPLPDAKTVGLSFGSVSDGFAYIGLCRSRSKIRPNDFLAWAGGRLTHCALTSHVRGRRGISVSRWPRELATAYLRVLSRLVGFSEETSISFVR